MQQVEFNRCLNQEVTYYGMKLTGLVFGVLSGLLTLIKSDFTVAIVGSVIGYACGAYLSMYWHKGHIQRWCYWHLPSQFIFRKKLPPSCYRKFL